MLRNTKYNEVPIEWDQAFEGFNTTHGTEVLQQLQNKLCEDRHVPMDILGNVSIGGIHQEMIALMLRYRCIGVHVDNLHGSVPSVWGEELPDFTECFASPFNHKFIRYFSMFDEDRVFGSLGNFFAFIEANNSLLPDGKYEINPPWNNVMFETVAAILQSTLRQARSDITAIIVGPAWRDAPPWVGQLESVRKSDRYSAWSLFIDKPMSYSQDVSDASFSVKTFIWVLTANWFDRNTLARLQILSKGAPPIHQ